MASTDWPFPGSRWWKFDFHTHTPASKDTRAWQQAKGTENEVTPEKWLLRFMAAEIDCVAVTDHNTGAWIDQLKSAYASMEMQDELIGSAGFRKLTIFPGVEISANNGVHVLAIFNPEATTSDIDTLLGSVGYQGTKGDSDGVTSKGIEEVIQTILDAGAIPIPAHADQGKGLLQAQSDSRRSRIDANTLRQAVSAEGLLAVEWCDLTNQFPECVCHEEARFSKVLGSDCHNFQGRNIPGSRFTWVKMANSTLDGLRLALLDGNEISIRRSDEGDFKPFGVPDHVITAIDIEEGRYIGKGKPARLEFSPFFNAIVGGRGTGKSTLVHALRLAVGRGQELATLGPGSEPRAHFDDFRKTSRGRDGTGALGSNSEIRVEWRYDDNLVRLRWLADSQAAMIEEWDGSEWQASSSQSINPARFPLRIFSQGQIAAMAGSGRQTLLSIIDEAANIDPHRQAFEEAQRLFLTQRARLRELEGKLAGQPEIERRLEETSRKLAALSQSDQATVLRAYGQSQHQIREVDALFEQMRNNADRITDSAEHIVLDDWSGQYFTEQDTDILALRKEVDLRVEQVRRSLLEQAKSLNRIIELVQQDARYAQWHSRTQAAQQAHAELQQQLEAQGVSDPQAFARLTQEKQQLEAQCKHFGKMREDREHLKHKIQAQRSLMSEKRQAITRARQDFVQQTLDNNNYVRIEVVPFGYEARQIERGLRELVDATDDRFAGDILSIENGEAESGMALDLAQAHGDKKIAKLKDIKRQLLEMSDSLSGHFRNYLARKHEKPEFADHVMAWVPEDDLRIQYRRGNEWSDIKTGSQGQRSAALLAFLLAFGDEPIVLDQPEDDLDNHLIYDLVVRQIRENKLRRQLIIVTHNPNVVVNGDAELVHVTEFGRGQCFVQQNGSLQDREIRTDVCRVMEGGHEAFARRWKRLGAEV
ncbi:TrlF family AAA-like ATPase [Halomonas beimenensis]|uniref:PHP N-terminal domain protein n=1 Tax=Halomonas beimenensis TaxID=475662 RepID=A0A291P8Z3_9GAMM|nr:AAA family ATPase [Halomonas beimenensis]ATJ83386.1 PHP N-terminal domain protein [Halomonas beimenensis]